jgi:hypothetical protein
MHGHMNVKFKQYSITAKFQTYVHSAHELGDCSSNNNNNNNNNNNYNYLIKQ